MSSSFNQILELAEQMLRTGTHNPIPACRMSALILFNIGSQDAPLNLNASQVNPDMTFMGYTAVGLTASDRFQDGLRVARLILTRAVLNSDVATGLCLQMLGWIDTNNVAVDADQGVVERLYGSLQPMGSTGPGLAGLNAMKTVFKAYLSKTGIFLS